MIYDKNIKVFMLLGIVLLLTSIFVDDYIANSIHTPILPIVLLSTWWFLGLVTITMIALTYRDRGKRITLTYSLLIGAILLATQTLKLFFERMRPSDFTHDFSFPSGHSSLSFALVPIAFAHSKKAGFIMLIVASMIAASRVLLTEHYFSDIVAGGIMGYSISWIYIKIISRDDQ
jgi:undecaprenyl-diphosphatase